MDTISQEQHNIEIHQNLALWEKKPLLKEIYLGFYKQIASQINRQVDGTVVELGSGIGNIKLVVPEAVCTDLFANPWIDQTEDAYKLSFADESVSNIILFDVWHHLEYPGNALAEFQRVLKKGGRVIIFDPAMSLLGIMVYGIFHHEPIALFDEIRWWSPKGLNLLEAPYYAAQGNATRVFWNKKYLDHLQSWKIVSKKKISSLSYVLSGGYSKNQLYPDSMLGALKVVDKVADNFAALFATRLLVVLEKK